jgi:hypothetical protein
MGCEIYKGLKKYKILLLTLYMVLKCRIFTASKHKFLKGKSNMKNNLLRTLKITPSKELVYRCQDDKPVLHIKYYVSPHERRDLIQEVKEAGLSLFEYYLSLISKGEQLISDDVTAKHFGWDVAKAKRLRQNLIKAGWFRSESFTYSGGRKGITYYMGKAAVRKGSNITPMHP